MSWLFIIAIVVFAAPLAVAVTSLTVIATKAAKWQASATTDELRVVHTPR